MRVNTGLLFNALKCLYYLTLTNKLISLTHVAAVEIRKDVQSHPNWGLVDHGDDCGLSSSDRIIGGSLATLGQYPWITRLGYTIHPNNFNLTLPVYTCAGTILNDRYVLTAAHCCPPYVEELPEGITAILATVRMGEYDVRRDPDCRNGVCAPPVQDITVQEYMVHPQYEDRQNDICLVRLQSQIQFNKYVSPVCLPVQDWFVNNTFKHHVMEVAGWGVSDKGTNAYSKVLKTLKVAVVPNNKCAKSFQGRTTITPKHICAGAVEGQDSCIGDSGGPLMAALSMDAPPRYYHVGVVSFGDVVCGTKDVPGVYARVPEYLTWILDHIKK